MPRVTITLRAQEKEALRRLAALEYRDYRSQAAVIILRELECRGLLPAEPSPATPPAQEGRVSHE